jgi:CRISPR-associated protein Cst2
MSHITGILLIDAPASALNNAGKDTEARTDNAVAVKFIRTPGGNRMPYVSAQALRYWVRTQLASTQGWSSSPVFRETKVAYTDADPVTYDEDDLFGYMRAASKGGDEKKAAKRAEIAARSTPVDSKVGEVTRISPFRVGTLVSTHPVRIVTDFGTMARAEGDPVPHEHQFYRAHLKAPFAVDLTAAGTFFVSSRVGFKNLDSKRIERAQAKGCQELTVRGLSAWRLPLPVRRQRVAALVRALGRIEGGAKQTLHLTDTAPSILVLAVCRNGNQPLQRLFTADELEEHTVLRLDVLEENLRSFGPDLESDIYFGWARGFLDGERARLEKFLGERKAEDRPIIRLGHPREMADAFAQDLTNSEVAEKWFQ